MSRDSPRYKIYLAHLYIKLV